MDKVIIIRYSEIHLKGKNRRYFENLLLTNIKNKLKNHKNINVVYLSSRYIVSGYDESRENVIIDDLKHVFGIFSISKALSTTGNPSDIFDACKSFLKSTGTFRFTVNRADKTLPYTSVSLAMELGGMALDLYPALSVDLHNPDVNVFVDVRNQNTSYVYSDYIIGAGGLPVGSGGKALSLLSGGIDSPVSSYLMAKRGLKLTYLHFWSYPYTSLEAKNKVIELATILSKYTGDADILIAPLTKVQEAIHKYADSSYMITLVRRAMLRIADRICKSRGLQCIVNGENLGQVASQTVESITCTGNIIKDFPIFRPLIGFDKIEIIDISEKIGTYNVSILPYEDCCTVFLPDKPVTKPTIEKAEENEKRIPEYDKLIDDAFNNIELVHIRN